MPVEFLDAPADVPADVPGGRRGPRWWPVAVALAVLAGLAVLVVTVVRSNTPPPTGTATPDAALASRFAAQEPLRRSADRYERQIQCLGTAARALAAMPQAYRRAQRAGLAAPAREAAAREVLADDLNAGPGTPAYDAFASVWAEHRSELVRGAPGALSRLTGLACTRLGR